MPVPSIYVFEDAQTDGLFPLTYSRAACELRVGTGTLLERMARNLAAAGQTISGLLVRSPLAAAVRQRSDIPTNPALSTRDGILLLNARWLMLGDSAQSAITSAPDSAGLSQNTVVWLHLSAPLASHIDLSKLHEPHAFDALLAKIQRLSSPATLIRRPWDLLDQQRPGILEDFAALGAANHGTTLPGAHLLSPENIYLGQGVKIWPGAVIDAQQGPVIIGDHTEIRANAVLTGPLAIGRHCVIRTGADIRENCSFGPNSRVGGEIINTVFQGNANKQHLGFLGQSVIGEWVNLGAGTTTSNLKNTYGTIRMPTHTGEEETGRAFLGSIIADHAKLGIGTYLSTGSVIGFGSHVVTARPPRVVPSFGWLTEKGLRRADFDKIEKIAALVMKRRHAEFTPADHELFVHIASESAHAENVHWPEN